MNLETQLANIYVMAIIPCFILFSVLQHVYDQYEIKQEPMLYLIFLIGALIWPVLLFAAVILVLFAFWHRFLLLVIRKRE